MILVGQMEEVDENLMDVVFGIIGVVPGCLLWKEWGLR